MDDTILKYYFTVGFILTSFAVVGTFLIVLRLVLIVDHEIVIMGISMTPAI